MIELHYRPNHAYSEELLDNIDRMVLAVKRVNADESSFPSEKLPLFVEGDSVYSSPADIRSFLDELNNQLTVERTVSGDSCYINPTTGEKC
jgi:hypothetical protein